MRVPSLATALWLAAFALLALTAAFVLWRGAPGTSQAPTRVVAKVPAKVLAKPKPPKKVEPPPSAYALEQQMTPRELLNRWDPLIADASKHFDVPQVWIRAVIVAESGGRTMSSETQPITSRAGALGIMQLMPQTYADMRAAYGLGVQSVITIGRVHQGVRESPTLVKSLLRKHGGGI